MYSNPDLPPTNGMIAVSPWPSLWEPVTFRLWVFQATLQNYNIAIAYLFVLLFACVIVHVPMLEIQQWTTRLSFRFLWNYLLVGKEQEKVEINKGRGNTQCDKGWKVLWGERCQRRSFERNDVQTETQRIGSEFILDKKRENYSRKGEQQVRMLWGGEEPDASLSL